MAPDEPMAVEEVWKDWRDTINMTAREIENWLETPASKALGLRADGEEDHAGRRVARILRLPKTALSDQDVEHMREVVAYVRRRRAQRPFGDIRDSRWRYSLMNWGHDPLKS